MALTESGSSWESESAIPLTRRVASGFSFGVVKGTELTSTPPSGQRGVSPPSKGARFISRHDVPELDNKKPFAFTPAKAPTMNLSRNVPGAAPPRSKHKDAASSDTSLAVIQQPVQHHAQPEELSVKADTRMSTSPQDQSSPVEMRPQDHDAAKTPTEVAHPQPSRPAIVLSEFDSYQQQHVDVDATTRSERYSGTAQARHSKSTTSHGLGSGVPSGYSPLTETFTTKIPGPAMSSATKAGQVVESRSIDRRADQEPQQRSSSELETTQDICENVEIDESEVINQQPDMNTTIDPGFLHDLHSKQKQVPQSSPTTRSISTQPVTTVVPQQLHAKDAADPPHRGVTQQQSRANLHSTTLIRSDGNKVQKSRLKSKQHNAGQGPRQANDMHAPTAYRSQDLFQIYQLTLKSEQAQDIQRLMKDLHDKDALIHRMRVKNEDLAGNLTEYGLANTELRETYEKQEITLRSYAEKVRKFAGYMSRLDTDFPKLQNELVVLKNEMKSHVNVDYGRIKENIAESRAGISHCQATYQKIVQNLKSELVRADEHSKELKKQLSDNAGRLAEEKYRCQSLEKQLLAAAAAKDESLQDLAKLQGQYCTLQSLEEQYMTREDEKQTSDALGAIMGLLEDMSNTNDVQSRMQKLEETIKHLHDSHSSRLENISKAQAEISADGNPLEQRLKGSIAKIAHDLGDAQTLQARNETLLSQNAKLEQQFEHVNEQVADLLKERVALTSIRSSLEQQVQKSAEDLAGLRERLMGVAKTPNIQESLQVGLLQTENFNLKQEAEQLRQKCEKSNDSSGELSRLIETLKAQVEQSEERVHEMGQASEVSEREWQEKLADEGKKAKEKCKLALEGMTRKLQAKYENLEKTNKADKVAMDKRLEEIHGELQKSQNKVNVLQKDKAELMSSTEDVHQARKQADNLVAQLQERIAGLQKTITKHEQSETAHAADRVKSNKEVDELHRKTTAQVSEYNKLSENYKKLQFKVSALENDNLSCKADSEAKEKSFQQQLSTTIEVQNQLLTAEIAVTDTKTELEQEQRRTQDIRRQLEVLQAAKDEACRLAEGQLSELRTQVQIRSEQLETTRQSERELHDKLAATGPANQARAQVQVGDSQAQSTQASRHSTQSTFAGLSTYAPEALDETVYSYTRNLDPALLTLGLQMPSQNTAVEETQLTQRRSDSLSQTRVRPTTSSLTELSEHSPPTPQRTARQSGQIGTLASNKSHGNKQRRISGPSELHIQDQNAPKQRPASNSGATRSVTPAGDGRRSGSSVRFAQDDHVARSRSSQHDASPLAGRQLVHSQTYVPQSSDHANQAHVESARSQSSTQSPSRPQVTKSNLKKRQHNEETDMTMPKRAKTGITPGSTQRLSDNTTQMLSRSPTVSSTEAGAGPKPAKHNGGRLRRPSKSKIRGSQGSVYGIPNSVTRTPSSRSTRSSSIAR